MNKDKDSHRIRNARTFPQVALLTSLFAFGCNIDYVAAADNIRTGNIKTGNIKTGNIKTGNIQTGNIQTGNIKTGTIQTGGIQTGNIQSGVINSGSVQTGSIQDGKIQSGVGTSQSNGPQNGEVKTGSNNTREIQRDKIKDIRVGTNAPKSTSTQPSKSTGNTFKPTPPPKNEQNKTTPVPAPQYGPPYPIKTSQSATSTSDYNFEKELQKFPESYRPALIELHKKHPQWQFVADNTGVDFNKFLQAEMLNGHVCTPEQKYGYNPPWRDPKYKYDNGYYAASPEAVAYFMDPRNFLTERQVFQFFSAKYNPTTQNIDSVKKVLSRNRLSKKAETFLEAGNTKVSAVFLAAKSSIETSGGNSDLATGKVRGYAGWYNMYGFGAYDGNANVNGAKKAKELGWNTPEKAIIGGAEVIYNSYIVKGQDTLYSMKWNVNNYKTSGKVGGQYATHIKDAVNKADRFAEALSHADAPFTFRIPVYENMSPKSHSTPSKPTIKK
ncbi:N-acetylglucosaminidase [Brevibacillus migulae]|uniref:N-acetylglucosaminidase n=1 Tax=Brevibacillus migulae TaxID=1644114 RepID=UPI00106EBD07|nr:hypothetical protein [Brevibacillus migulae]